jgi:hypothetical protein
MSARAVRIRRVREVLELRDAVLRYLAPGSDARATERLDAATPSTWSLLLQCECCALPLVARLRSDGTFARLGAATQQCLSSAEAAELQRVLAARLLVRELDALGVRDGVRFTLLKGAALAADSTRPPLDLGDVDVLATPETRNRAWSALLANGWTPAAPGLLPTDELGARPHYAPLRSERHELPLELHERFEYGLPAVAAEQVPETIPIAGYRSIDRLTGPRAVAATLRHSVVAHPHRRGHLRDLFLLDELLRELDEGQVGAATRHLQTDVQSVELLAMLNQARALSRAEDVMDREVLRPFVCFKYAAVAGTSRLLGIRSAAWSAWSHVPLERPAVRRASYRRALRGALEPLAPDWWSYRHRAVSSRLARAVGLPRLVRVVRRAGLVLALVAAGGAIRRHVATLDRAERG